jgi:WD40 repeat protein/serine/threonine protein kinase
MINEPKSADGIPLNWKTGEVIADLYEVKGTTAGGMGAVYFVNHLKWGIPLAVKTPLPAIVKHEPSIQRFIKEAETWINLGVHPNIASCYYVRKLGGLPRIFIEYVDGGTLRDSIEENRPLDLTDVLDKAIQISRGMAYVHDHGVIHRDLKPANCMITKDGTVKITDFGIAKIGDDIADPLGIQFNSSDEGCLSMTGSSFGTPEYMPPEQFDDAKHVGKEADIYSFGVMLFEMICGQRPFQVPPNAHPNVRHHFYKDAHKKSVMQDLHNFRRDCPRTLCDLVDQCTQKDPRYRCSTFDEVEKVLKDIYRNISSFSYSSPKPDIVKLRADSLNNKAVSLLELGLEEQALKSWEEALKNDPGHLAATLNIGYYLWMNRQLDPIIFYNNLESLATANLNNPDYWHQAALIGYDIGLSNRAEDAIRTCNHLGVNLSTIRQYSPLIWWFNRDNEGIKSTTITPDGQYVILGCADSNIRLWRIETRQCEKVLSGHSQAVTSVHATSDSKYLLSMSIDKTLRVWDLTQGRCIRAVPEDGYVGSFQTTMNNENFFITDILGSKMTHLNIATGHVRVLIFEGHTAPISEIAVSLNGQYVVTGSADKTLRIWNVKKGCCDSVISTLPDEPTLLAITPDGQYVISASLETNPRLWNTISGECLNVLKGHTDFIHDLKITIDGKYALTACDDNNIRIWSIPEGICLKELKDITGGATQISITSSGHIIAISFDHFRVWEFASGKCICICEGHAEGLESAHATENANYILSTADEKEINLWQILSRKHSFNYLISKPSFTADLYKNEETEKALIHQAKSFIKEMKFHEAYNALKRIKEIPQYARNPEVIGMIKSCTLFAKRRTGLHDICCSKVLKGHSDAVSAVCICKDSQYIFSGSRDHTVRIWDFNTGDCLIVLKGHSNAVRSISISEDGKHIICADCDNVIRFWDIREGKCLHIIDGFIGNDENISRILNNGSFAITTNPKTHESSIWQIQNGLCKKIANAKSWRDDAISISRDGKYLIQGTTSIMIDEIAYNKRIMMLPGHKILYSTSVSTDFNYLISVDSGRNFKRWDLKTGQCINVINFKHGEIDERYLIPISNDAKYVLSADGGNSICIWDMENKKCIATAGGHGNSINSLSLGSNGTHAVSGSSDGTIRVWEFDWEWEFHD